MPLKTEKMTGKVRNIVEAVEGYYSPHLFGVVVCALGASNTEKEFLKCLEHGLEKLSAEISVMRAQINSIGEN